MKKLQAKYEVAAKQEKVPYQVHARARGRVEHRKMTGMVFLRVFKGAWSSTWPCTW